MNLKVTKGTVCQQVILVFLLVSQINAREIARLDAQAEEGSLAIETESKATADEAPLTIQSETIESSDDAFNENIIDEVRKEIQDEPNANTEELIKAEDNKNQSKINESLPVQQTYLKETADEASSSIQAVPKEEVEESQSAFSQKEQNPAADEAPLSVQQTVIADASEGNPVKDTETKAALDDEISEAPIENDELLSTSTSAPDTDALGQDKQFAGVIEAIVSIFLPTTTRPITTTTTQAPQRECPDCECGRINTYRKIVGGENTEVNEYPWMTLLRQNGRFFCGGSVINDLYVLTAAHCVIGLVPTQLTMRILQYQRETQSMTTIERRAAAIQINERYNPRTYDNDIALIRLREPLEFDDLLRPVCLPEEGNSYADDEAIVTGWGATSEGGPLADVLQEVRVPIFSNERCRMTSYGSSQITDNMLCAGNLTGGMDSCQGDSGGPLHVNSDSVYEQPGIVSWGNGCARPDAPGVYTRVTRYLTWIGNRTRDGCYCDRDDGEELADKQTITTTLISEKMNE